MRKLALTAVILVVYALASVAPALASCSYHTYMYGGQIVTCTTCCFGSHCNTSCF